MKKKKISKVIFKFRTDVKPPHDEKQLQQFLSGNDAIPWNELVKRYPGISCGRLFVSVDPNRIDQLVRRAKEKEKTRGISYRDPVINNYFAIQCPSEIDEKKLVMDLKNLKAVETAYVESKPQPPPAVNPNNDPRSVNQQYLNPSPVGINARFAWTIAGGDGNSSVKFIDIEQGWNLNHEDLRDTTGPKVTLVSGINKDYRKHGTNVLGVILAQDNNTGCVGIAPSVSADVISEWRNNNDTNLNTADAILTAIERLNPGDVILIEAQKNLLPVETEPAIFDAIELGASCDIIIIEPAGNGNNDLDNYQDDSRKFVLNTNHNDFKDSGAIMIAAASRSRSNVYSKRPDSNFGSRIDCFAWGHKINTTSSDDAATRNKNYVSNFSRTSGASAIIAGAAISLQSMSEQILQSRFDSLAVRSILSDVACATLSKSPATDRIGVMPDLSLIVAKYIRQGAGG